VVVRGAAQAALLAAVGRKEFCSALRAPPVSHVEMFGLGEFDNVTQAPTAARALRITYLLDNTGPSLEWNHKVR